ncbi:family A G protein-coupled receptor-like protein [Parathielavia appendiculata]|uniref:Family A G protein-coupled receptor-like protein n=1 Tax=Parathielavia appendiculata TaxID=2587402 RepID=A0AAN6TYJ5_9PEZI|nr:family A G protein-coupled receptor-like protein [Parathielavia appendiculata]
MAILLPRNDALNTHPPAGDQYLTTNGSNWLFAVAALFGFSTLIFYALKFRARAGERFFHYVFIIASLVGLIAYYAMASDLGWDLIRQSNQVNRSGFFRQIFWPKYVFWVVEFPAVILALGVLSGVSWATIIFNIFLSWIWIIAYLVAAYTPSNYKWGFFAFGFLAHLFLLYSTLVHGLRSANRVAIKRDYLPLAAWTNFLWLLYPIAWGLTDGGNYLGVVAGFIWFGILDLLLLLGVGYAIVALSRRWDYHRLNIAFTQYGRVPTAAGTFPEKEAAHASAAATPAGTTAV